MMKNKQFTAFALLIIITLTACGNAGGRVIINEDIAGAHMGNSGNGDSVSRDDQTGGLADASAPVVTAEGFIRFSGGVDNGDDAEYVNPTRAELIAADCTDIEAAVLNWWITRAGEEDIVYRGEGLEVSDALANMLDSGAEGSYILLFRAEPDTGGIYSVERSFYITPSLDVGDGIISLPGPSVEEPSNQDLPAHLRQQKAEITEWVIEIFRIYGGLKPTANPQEQLEYVDHLANYVVANTTFASSLDIIEYENGWDLEQEQSSLEELEINEIYKLLVRRDEPHSSSVTSAVTLALLLNEIGIDAVYAKKQQNLEREAFMISYIVLFTIDSKQYFSDPALLSDALAHGDIVHTVGITWLEKEYMDFIYGPEVEIKAEYKPTLSLGIFS